MKSLLIGSLTVFAQLIAIPSTSLANMPAPPIELILQAIDGNRVQVCLSGTLCASGPEMLRMDQADNTVRLDPASCVSNMENWTACFEDPCLAPGTYRYGPNRSGKCNGNFSDVTRYVIADVTAPLSNCQQTTVPPEPAEPPPWRHLEAVERCDAGCSLAGFHGSPLIIAVQLLAVVLG